VLHTLILISGVLFVLIFGSIEAGGLSEIWNINNISGRFDMLE